MNVAVTGATGFVGGHLVDRLLGRGDTVTALVRSTARAASLAQRGVHLIEGDLAATAAIAEAVRGQEVVYHLAGMLGAANEADLMAVNRDGTLRLAQACAACSPPPRLVVVSSMAAGGPAQRGIPKVADGDDHPVTMYGRSKLAAERVLPALALPWTVLRPPVVYGPGDREGFLSLFRAVRWGIAPMFGDGSMEISLIHVADLAEALIAAGNTADVAGEVFYVSHPEITTGAGLMRSIAQYMQRTVLPLPIPEWAARIALTLTGGWADLVHHPSILYPDKVHEFYQAAWTADPSPFMHATGWQATWGLAEGITDTGAWYRKKGWI
jgi:nucleoside-diphosphate-sugar epimerase